MSYCHDTFAYKDEITIQYIRLHIPLYYGNDIIIVGGGLAGLRAAVGLCDRYDVGLFSKVHPIRSHSIAAQGGVNAALGNNPEGKDDSWEKHSFDTIKGSDYLADQNAVELMCREAIDVVYEWNTGDVPSADFPTVR